MNKYFKFPAESNLGIGVQYIEFNDSGWAVRQAECYEGKWFNSSKSYHEELTSSSLCDQKLTESGIKLGDPVDAQEFEDIWKLSNQVATISNLITKKESKESILFNDFLHCLEIKENLMRSRGESEFSIKVFHFWNLQAYFIGTFWQKFFYFIWQKP
jgi:hypothetical protein